MKGPSSVKSVILSLALAAIAAPVIAAPPPVPAAAAPAPADPAAMAAAERLMDGMNYDKLMDDMIGAIVGQFRQSMPAQIDKITEKSEKKLPDDLKAKLIEVAIGSMERTFRDNKATFRRDTARIYARHFTAVEIDRMTEIQKDPVMIKMQAKMPTIMAESMALTQEAMADEMPRMLDEVKKLVAEYLADQPETEAASPSRS